jgi:hypothetical protein
MDPDFMVIIINNYIEFYKTEIQDISLFTGINDADIASTNIQLNVLYSEMKKYQNLNENSKDVEMITSNELKKFTIYKDDTPYCTSDYLFTVLIEISNLKENDNKSKYQIKKQESFFTA